MMTDCLKPTTRLSFEWYTKTRFGSMIRRSFIRGCKGGGGEVKTGFEKDFHTFIHDNRLWFLGNTRTVVENHSKCPIYVELHRQKLNGLYR